MLVIIRKPFLQKSNVKKFVSEKNIRKIDNKSNAIITIIKYLINSNILEWKCHSVSKRHAEIIAFWENFNIPCIKLNP